VASGDLLARGKRSIAVNLKVRGGTQLLRKMIAQADVLIDTFRPGVLERLGLGPNIFLGQNGLNPKLIYTRVVGQVISFGHALHWSYVLTNVTRFSPSGHHKDMAGSKLTFVLKTHFNRILGHDLNYLAISGVLSVRSLHTLEFFLFTSKPDDAPFTLGWPTLFPYQPSC
jgi:alpha-methylacyl-CoA racemase